MTRCPTCKKPANKAGNKLYPFCGERCHLIDLGKWLDEEYRVPEAPEAGSGESPTPQSEDEH